ncbi:MAG: hypothetical protein K8R87_01360 [Verrucomicrobia bacterium]|nr:hypothetical protein [Verrucomicrobiota bacterium]
MKVFCISGLLASAMALTSCGLAQAPLNMMSRMLYKGGNMMNMRAENNKSPEDFQLESSEVKSALASRENRDAEPQVAGAGLALR